MNYIIQDTDLSTEIGDEWFNVDWLSQNNLITGHATGRATAYFVQHFSHNLVLRHYMRGGLMAQFSKDKYLWTGLKNSRPWKEWNLTNSLYQQGLPVPRPIAAQVIRNGIFYQGNILTQKIAHSHSFHEIITSGRQSEELNYKIGGTIRKFHDINLYHSDLNVNNILISNTNDIFLIDFDKCRYRNGDKWKDNNLDRLNRSITKTESQILMSDNDHISHQIRRGYHSCD